MLTTFLCHYRDEFTQGTIFIKERKHALWNTLTSGTKPYAIELIRLYCIPKNASKKQFNNYKNIYNRQIKATSLKHLSINFHQLWVCHLQMLDGKDAVKLHNTLILNRSKVEMYLNNIVPSSRAPCNKNWGQHFAECSS